MTRIRHSAGSVIVIVVMALLTLASTGGVGAPVGQMAAGHASQTSQPHAGNPVGSGVAIGAHSHGCVGCADPAVKFVHTLPDFTRRSFGACTSTIAQVNASDYTYWMVNNSTYELSGEGTLQFEVDSSGAFCGLVRAWFWQQCTGIPNQDTGCYDFPTWSNIYGTNNNYLSYYYVYSVGHDSQVYNWTDWINVSLCHGWNTHWSQGTDTGNWSSVSEACD